MPNFELPFPFGGLNDNQAQSKQPSGTTSDAVNVRGIDPVTGRIRGGQRSGLARYMPEAMEARIRRMEKVVYDNRQLNYVPRATPLLVWEKSNANTNSSTYAVVDFKENIFVIDEGKGLQKFNKNGVLIYTLAPPIENQDFYLRGLAIDQGGYLWLSTGHKNPSQLAIAPSPFSTLSALAQSKIWCYKENDYGTAPELQYAVSPGLAIEKLVLRNNILYACANDPIGEDGYCVAYSDIYTTGMEEQSRRRLPYPLCDIDIDTENKLYFAAPQNVNRYDRQSQQHSSYGKTLVDWTPANLPAGMLWSWYDASQVENVADGSRVTAWFDSSGNSRNLGCTITETGPKWQASAWAGRPCFDFDGTAQLYTPGSQPTDATSQSSSLSAIPNYTGAKWAMFIVFRPQVGSAEEPITAPSYLFGIDTSSTERNDIHVAIHKAQSLDFPGTLGENQVCLNASTGVAASYNWQRGTTKRPDQGQPTPALQRYGLGVKDVGAGKYRLPASTTLDANNNASVLTIIYTGPAVADGANSVEADLHCSFHLNGRPIDRWRGMQQAASLGFYLGRQAPSLSTATSNWFKGQVAEIITVHNLDSSFDRGYPRTLGLASKTTTSAGLTTSLGWVTGASTTLSGITSVYSDIGSLSSIQTDVLRGTAVPAALNSELRQERGDVVLYGGIYAPIWRGEETYTIGGSATACLSLHAYGSISMGSAGTWSINPVGLYSTAKTFVAGVTNANALLCEKIEGYLAWKWGIWRSLPSGSHVAPTLGMNTTYNPGNWPHPYRYAPPASDSALTQSKYISLIAPTAITGCFESLDGPLRWIVDQLSTNKPGIGLQVKAAGSSVYTMGDAQTAGSSTDAHYTWLSANGNARKLAYDPATQIVSDQWTTVPGSAATVNLGASSDGLPKLSVDQYENPCYPFFESAAAYGWTMYADDSSASPIVLNSLAGGTIQTLMVVPEAISPDYRFGAQPTDDFPATPNPLDPDTYPRAENIFVLNSDDVDTTTIERYELIETSATPGSVSPRSSVVVAVAAGKIKTITSSGVGTPAGLGTLAEPQLDVNAPYIDSATLFGKVYFTDGLKYFIYNPKTDVVSPWEPTDAGSLPNRCKLLTNWRGRAVLARGADDPHNWHMSEQGNPNGWDIFPPVQTATQAISGNNARAGLCPDLINSLIPYNDDLLLFGCDSSLWMMRGDPMAGGVFDQVSDITGVAFGRSWAKDPEGTLYFFGSRGGVYMMKPGSIPVSMTQATIERRLTDVDLGQFYVEMFWNTFDDGLHVLLMPFTDTQTHTTHFFWERKTGAWFQDEFGPSSNTNKQPSAAIVIDGDAPEDRCLLIGTYDGYLSKWDKNAVNDDGVGIFSRVLIGPIAPDDSQYDSRISNLAAVMGRQGSVNYRLFASSTPDVKGEPVESGMLIPGRNPVHLVRARGAFVWLELYQANVATRWALESLRMDAYPAGRKRNG